MTEVLDSLNNLSGKDTAAAELTRILQEPHFKVILNLPLDFILTLRALSSPQDGQADFLDYPFVGVHVRGFCG